MARIDDLLNISLGLSEAVLSQNKWPNALRDLADGFGGSFATFEVIDKKTGVHIEHQDSSDLEIQAKYHGYIERQQAEIDKQKRHESTQLSIELDYAKVTGLSNEVAQKLNQHKPTTIGQASRISGVTPAAVSLLLVHLKKHRRVA